MACHDERVSERLIRGTHPYAFRSGEWAVLKGTTLLPGFPEGERECYLVEFPDGMCDFWAVSGVGYGYEFSEVP